MSASELAEKTATIVVAGIGNYYRRDDAAGLLVAREMEQEALEGVRVVECTGASLELIEAWEGADTVILVDAVSSGSDPGKIFELELHDQPIPAYLFHRSTHDFTVADTVELARLLGKLPPRVKVFGIEGADFGQGIGLSVHVALSVDRVIRTIKTFIRNENNTNQ